MTEHVVNWFVDTLARTETLDLYFEITELIDFPHSDSDLYGTAEGDALANEIASNAQPRQQVPLGKQVF